MNTLSPARRQLVAEIVGALAPHEPALAPAARERALRDTVRFVASQIEAMPSYLRLPYLLALSAFDWLALLRHGRRFPGLAPARREAWIESWSASALAPRRDFVKLLRSCTLLAFFDHPAVRARLIAEAGAGSRGAPQDEAPAPRSRVP